MYLKGHDGQIYTESMFFGRPSFPSEWLTSEQGMGDPWKEPKASLSQPEDQVDLG